MRALAAVIAGLLLLLPLSAGAASPVEDAQKAELERVRGKVANQVQLSAYDLVDELIYGWTQAPPFDEPTPVVLAGVTVPVGLGTGLQALLENHLSNGIIMHPSSQVELVHCPACTQVVVQSGPQATVVTRGIDNPDVLQELGTQKGLHGLFIDVEAEGAFLVLRARITRLDGSLAIVWSRTLSSSTSSPALLRDPDHLKSAEAARQEYLDALKDRGNVTVIGRLGVRTYNRGFGSGNPPPPFLWVQGGAELAPTEAMDWTAAFVIGGSYIPSDQAYRGVMGEARIGRLLTGRVRSHTRPDLYFYAGGSVQALWGPATAPFTVQPVTADEILRQPDPPRFVFGTLLMGFDLRLGNRIGFSVFLESYPTLDRSENIGTYIRPIGIPFQSLGTEVVLCF